MGPLPMGLDKETAPNFFHATSRERSAITLAGEIHDQSEVLC